MDITNKDLKDLKSSSKQVMERAFNDIYQEYKLLVYFVSFDILKNQEDAKDITNEQGVSIDSISSKYKRTLDKVKKHYKGEDNE